MRIIIVGCGKVGSELAGQLSAAGHDLTLIDLSERRLDELSNTYDLATVKGSGTSYHILREAGVQDTDLLIAVTTHDEINLLSCLIARKASGCHAIARVRDPEYVSDLGFIRDELPEQRLPQTPSEGEIAQALEKEAALIESKLLPGASVIAMCVEGKPMSSEQLADYFGKLTVSGTSKICVLIGGSCGLSERVKKKAALRLSMSPMTFPHHLARVMVLEQIYRALNIAAGGKYHK